MMDPELGERAVFSSPDWHGFSVGDINIGIKALKENAAGGQEPSLVCNFLSCAQVIWAAGKVLISETER